MSEPFLIIDEILVPEPDFDGYHAYEDILREQIPMISGRLVEEVRGKVWRIDYTSERMSDSETRRLLAALRWRRAFAQESQRNEPERKLFWSGYLTAIESVENFLRGCQDERI